MGIALITAVCALAGSAILLFEIRVRSYAVVALLVSGLEVAIAKGLARLHIVGIPLGKVLPALLVILGILMLLRVQSKSRVIAATIVVLSGAIHLAAIFRLL